MTWKAPRLENTAIPDLRDASMDFSAMINVVCLGRGIDLVRSSVSIAILDYGLLRTIDVCNHLRRLVSLYVSWVGIKKSMRFVFFINIVAIIGLCNVKNVWEQIDEHIRNEYLIYELPKATLVHSIDRKCTEKCIECCNLLRIFVKFPFNCIILSIINHVFG